MSVAGQQLSETIFSRALRTGESAVFPAFSLPCSAVVAGVDPRYAFKYYSASVNTLHSCVRASLELAIENNFSIVCLTPIWSKNKDYPEQDAIHIVLRSIRKFFDHCIQTQSELSCKIILNVPENIGYTHTYRTLLDTIPYYFPRTAEEASATSPLLPCRCRK
ncbi:hypothetical protein GEMRC1_002448 [Eukaryota sp. GEM-RC1]